MVAVFMMMCSTGYALSAETGTAGVFQGMNYLPDLYLSINS